MATATRKSTEALAWRAAVAGLCSFETVAITTGKVPTLSSLMWRTPMAPRLAIWTTAAVILTDHFVTRRWS